MKRILTLLLAAALMISCCACAGKKTPAAEEDPGEAIAAVFPDGVTLCGVDVSGQTAEEAKAAVEERAKTYVLTLSLDGKELEFDAEALKLTCGTTDYETILQACIADSEKRTITVDELITYDILAVETALKNLSGDVKPAKNAYVEYSEKEKKFVLVPEEQGGGINIDAVLEAVKEAVPQLKDLVELDAETIYQPAEITEDSPEAKTALEKANKMLEVTLQYTYAPDGKEAATETIDRETILPWLLVQEDGLTVEIDPGPLQEYVSSMDEAHSVSSGTSQFKTTGGSYIDIRVPSAGQTVDTDALYNDIFDCVTKGVSGEREAPYVKQDADSTANFGGNYVEVDLSAQHLWVYNGGTCVVSSDIVSGCVNTGHATPGGVYTIQSKETNRYLIGEGYKSWVNFWMPFNGGIGLHDADGWRWSYGGTIYQYSGSHGCINMPYSAAQATYSNVSVGTHVILYGGTSSVTPITQSISGTSSYTVNEGDASFTLDASPAYSTTLSYSSDNTSVATVSAGGVVTIVGPGVANITVTAAAKSGYSSATKTVTITVNTRCSQGDHVWNEGTITTQPTCTVEGVRTYTCTICGQTKTEAVPKVDHVSDAGTVTKSPTCGAAGVKTYSCTVCGLALRTEEIPATGQHTYDGGQVTTEPTCTTAGVRTYTCTVCGQTRTEEIPALGHNFEGGACTRCGEKDPAALSPEGSKKEFG